MTCSSVTRPPHPQCRHLLLLCVAHATVRSLMSSSSFFFFFSFQALLVLLFVFVCFDMCLLSLPFCSSLPFGLSPFIMLLRFGILPFNFVCLRLFPLLLLLFLFACDFPLRAWLRVSAPLLFPIVSFPSVLSFFLSSFLSFPPPTCPTMTLAWSVMSLVGFWQLGAGAGRQQHLACICVASFCFCVCFFGFLSSCSSFFVQPLLFLLLLLFPFLLRFPLMC